MRHVWTKRDTDIQTVHSSIDAQLPRRNCDKQDQLVRMTTIMCKAVLGSSHNLDDTPEIPFKKKLDVCKR